MNFKFIVAMIGIILATASSVWSQSDCVGIQVLYCDQYGNVYSDSCEFQEAQQLDSTLVGYPCDGYVPISIVY